MLCAGADSLAPLPISSKVWKTKFRTRSFYQWDRGIRLWAGCVLREGIHIHVHVHDIMKNPFPVHDSDWASGLCRPVQRRISNTQGEFSKSYLVLQYFIHNAHCTLRQAVVLANSDCQLEDQTAIETLKETLLSSLHDVINCVRCDHTSTCLLYICISTAYLLYIYCIAVYLLYIYCISRDLCLWPDPATRSWGWRSSCCCCRAWDTWTLLSECSGPKLSRYMSTDLR